MSNEFSLNGAVSSSSSLNNASSCTACGKKSDCKCDRCGDFYCSTECQLKDWPSHRFICFPIPKLVKVRHGSITKHDIPKLTAKDDNSLSENSPKCAYSQKDPCELPNGSCVLLTAFRSSNRCYIRSTNPSTVAEQEKVLKEINEFGKTASPLTSKPKNNTVALALRNEKWCRVQIVGFVNNGCTVAFIDFGDKTNIPQRELRKIVPSIRNLPCHIQVVQLRGVNFSSNQKVMNSLIQFTNKEYKIEYSKSVEKGVNVELFKWGSSISLNSLIQELTSKHKDNNDIDTNSAVSFSPNVEAPKTHFSEKENGHCENKKTIYNGKPLKRSEKEVSQSTNEVEKKIDNSLVLKSQKQVSTVPRQIQKPCLIPPFEVIPLTEKDHGSQILIMDNSFLESGYIGCLLEKYCENLKAVTEFLNKYIPGDQPYKPQYDEYCLAKFDDMWYRAKVEEVLSDDKFLVVYIDFTNENELSSESIRRYPLSLDLACCTTLCGIDGLPCDLPKNLKECLEEELKPFTILKIDSIKKKENICYLRSEDLLKKLALSKLM